VLGKSVRKVKSAGFQLKAFEQILLDLHHLLDNLNFNVGNHLYTLCLALLDPRVQLGCVRLCFESHDEPIDVLLVLALATQHMLQTLFFDLLRTLGHFTLHAHGSL
jgi:hypothetical protein